MLKGMVIGCLDKNIEEVLRLTEGYLPKITNWSVCDSFCAGLKITKKRAVKDVGFVKECWCYRRKFNHPVWRCHDVTT